MNRTTRRALAAVALVSTFGLGALSGAIANQPHMKSALGHMQQARGELEQASTDKGGHRVSALQALDAAIRETRAGIDYDRHH